MAVRKPWVEKLERALIVAGVIVVCAAVGFAFWQYDLRMQCENRSTIAQTEARAAFVADSTEIANMLTELKLTIEQADAIAASRTSTKPANHYESQGLSIAVRLSYDSLYSTLTRPLPTDPGSGQ